jgi:hypothetical protein
MAIVDEEEPRVKRAFAAARDAGLSQDYFLMWDIADMTCELMLRVFPHDEHAMFRARLLRELMLERVEELSEAKNPDNHAENRV